MITNTDRRLEILKNRIVTAKKTLEQFKERLDKHPVYAFEWARDAFYAAVEIDLLEEIIPILEEGKRTPEQIAESLQKDLMNKARSCGNRSTSQTSNLVDDYRIEVLAQTIEYLTSCMYA